MFIGHYALAFAAKKKVPRTSLGLSLLAVSWIDLLWPIFLLVGWEHVTILPGATAFNPLRFDSYPITHSLVMDVCWGALLGLAYFRFTRYALGAVWIGLAVLSHWFLDFIVHAPDLPLTPGGEFKVGLGLWNSIVGTMVLEGAMFAAGLWLYVKTTAARTRMGHVSLWSFVVFVLVMYVATAFGPPPPNPQALAWFALGAWLAPLWGWWIDRTREMKSPPSN